ncbi:MAG: DMT family transporter [Candidatus Marinimicrobia bacterium]|nr:DMT family transporter [Candidatus Neomarinimicrobiota bacterium]
MLVKESWIKSVLQALLVTFLWSTSFIIIKKGLLDIPPLTFAGLRYTLAFIFLLPLLFRKERFREIRNLAWPQWFKLIILGLTFYTVTQGAQFLGLSLLPAVTVSLMLNFTPLIVAVLGIFILREAPTKIQWLGVFLFIAGILFYFQPATFSGNTGIGLVVMTVGVLANAGAAVLGRDINRQKDISPVVVTIISMGIGSIILLSAGLITQGLPALSWKMLFWLLWLAGINTAFAFTLWNITLQTLGAMQSSIINGTMLIQIAILAWLLLGEAILPLELVGISVAVVGTVLVQLKKTDE